METQKGKVGGIIYKMRQKTISPKEVFKNHMMVGSTSKKTNTYCLYKPHNFRRYFDFSKKNFNPKPTPQTIPIKYGYKALNYNKEHLFSNIYKCSIRIKKSQAEVINHHVRWFRIDLKGIEHIKKQIFKITKRKEKECVRSLKWFIKHFGGSSKYKVLNIHSEDKIMAENFIDSLPTKMKFHFPPVKKVYNERNVEFQDPVFASNYLRNRAVEDVAPDIFKALTDIGTSMYNLNSNLIPTINDLNKNMKSHLSAIKNIDKSFKRFNSLMAQKKLNGWLK